MDRRALFFLVASAACLLMVPVGLSEYRDIAIGTAVVYFVFAVASYLDWRGRKR
jgi:hypothetical protein